MSTSIISFLTFIGKQMIIYGGVVLVIAGVIGNSLNVIVFLSLRTFRHNSCASYLTIMSFVNIGELLCDLLPRFILTTFNSDGTESSLIYCKSRLYLANVCTSLSLTCFCLATIDQYCATCCRPRLQQFCNIKLARYLVAFFSLFWILHAIPYLVFFQHVISPITNQITCIITNSIFIQYRLYVVIFLMFGILPLTISVFFGAMAFRNTQHISYYTIPIVRRELDKQLTTMVLLQVVFNIFCILPYVIVNFIVIHMEHVNDALIQAQIRLCNIIGTILYFVYFAIPFYIYIWASERFRRQLTYVLFKIYLVRWRRLRRPQIVINGVAPVT